MSTFEELEARVMYDLDVTDDPGELVALLDDPESRWYARARLAALASKGLTASTWNPLLHPRGRDGRFIKVWGWVRWVVEIDGKKKWRRGRVLDIDPDTGNLQVSTSMLTPDVSDTVLSHHILKTSVYSTPAAKATLKLPDPKAGTPAPGFVQTGGKGGSNPGGMYTIDAPEVVGDPELLPDGQKIYVKTAKSDMHARNEVLANRLYELAGVNVAETFMGDDGITVGSRLVPFDVSKKNIGDHLSDDEVMSLMRSDFVIDAWLSNWDVAGMSLENTQVVDGYPYRIDAGGALLYRAQGKPKGHLFGPVVGELETMRDSTMNSQAATLFGKTTDAELKDGGNRLAAIDPQDIKDYADAADLGPDLGDTLVARRADILFKLGIEDPYDKFEEPEDWGLPEEPVSTPTTPDVPLDSLSDPEQHLVNLMAYPAWVLGLEWPEEGTFVLLNGRPAQVVGAGGTAEYLDSIGGTVTLAGATNVLRTIDVDFINEYLAAVNALEDFKSDEISKMSPADWISNSQVLPLASTAPFVPEVNGAFNWNVKDAFEQHQGRWVIASYGEDWPNHVLEVREHGFWNHVTGEIIDPLLAQEIFQAGVVQLLDDNDFNKSVVKKFLSANNATATSLMDLDDAEGIPAPLSDINKVFTPAIGTDPGGLPSDGKLTWKTATLLTPVSVFPEWEAQYPHGAWEDEFPLTWGAFYHDIRKRLEALDVPLGEQASILVHMADTAKENGYIKPAGPGWNAHAAKVMQSQIDSAKLLPPSIQSKWGDYPEGHTFTWPEFMAKVKEKLEVAYGINPGSEDQFLISMLKAVENEAVLNGIITEADKITPDYNSDVVVTPSVDVPDFSTPKTGVDAYPSDSTLTWAAAAGLIPGSIWNEWLADNPYSPADNDTIYPKTWGEFYADLSARLGPDSPELASVVKTAGSLNTIIPPSDDKGFTEVHPHPPAAPKSSVSKYVHGGIDLGETFTFEGVADKIAVINELAGKVVLIHPKNDELLDGLLTENGYLKGNIPHNIMGVVEPYDVGPYNSSYYTYMRLRLPGGETYNINVNTTSFTENWNVSLVTNHTVDDIKLGGKPTLKADGTIVKSGQVIGEWSDQSSYWTKEWSWKLYGAFTLHGFDQSGTVYKKGAIREIVAGSTLPMAPPVKAKKASKAAAKVTEMVSKPITTAVGSKYVDGTDANMGDWVQATKGGGGFVGKIVGWPDQTLHPGLVFAVDQEGHQKIIKLKTHKKVDGPNDDGSITDVPNLLKHNDITFGDGKVPVVGQKVVAGKPGGVQVEGIVNHVNLKQGWVYILKDDGKIVSKTFSVTKVLEEPDLIWDIESAQAAAAALVTNIDKKPKKPKVGKIGYPGPDGAVVDQPEALKEAWLSGHPKRKLTKDGYAPQVGMLVRTKDGELATITAVAGEWESNPNSVSLGLINPPKPEEWGASIKAVKKASTTTIQLDHEAELKGPNNQPIVQISGLVGDGVGGAESKAFVHPVGTAIYRVKGKVGSFWQDGKYREIHEWKYLAVPPGSSSMHVVDKNNWQGTITEQVLGNPTYAFKQTPPKEMEKVAVIADTGPVLHVSPFQTKYGEAGEPTKAKFVDHLGMAWWVGEPETSAVDEGVDPTIQVVVTPPAADFGNPDVPQTPTTVITTPEIESLKDSPDLSLELFTDLDDGNYFLHGDGAEGGSLWQLTKKSAGTGALWYVTDIVSGEEKTAGELTGGVNLTVMATDSDEFAAKWVEAHSKLPGATVNVPAPEPTPEVPEAPEAPETPTPDPTPDVEVPTGPLPPKVAQPAGPLTPPPAPPTVEDPTPQAVYPDLPVATGTGADSFKQPVPPILAGTKAKTVAESVSAMLEFKDSTDPGTGHFYGMADSDLIEDMMFRQNIQVINGQEYLVTRARLREDLTEEMAAKVLTPDNVVTTKGDWKLKGMQFADDLQIGDQISVYVSGHTGLLKPSNNDPMAPNARVSSVPVLLGKSTVNTEWDLYRVQVTMNDGSVGEVDMESRPTGSIKTFDWDPDAIPQSSYASLSLTPVAGQAGWVRNGTMSVPGYSGSDLTEDTGKVDFGGNHVSNMAKGSGGHRFIRTLDNGTKIQWNTAHATESGTGNDTTRRAVISGEVRILTPLNPDMPDEKILESVSTALEHVGVPVEKQAPPDNETLARFAIQKLVANYHPNYTYRSKAVTGPGDKRVLETLEYMNKELGSHLEGGPITLDDVRLHTHTNGRVSVVLSPRVGLAMSKRQGNKYYGHSGVNYSLVSRVFAGPHRGVMATDERWSLGVMTTGQSSHADMQIGSGDRVYMRGHKDLNFHSGYVVMNAAVMNTSTEIYNNKNNDSDSFGRRGVSNKFMTTGGGVESMHKRAVDVEHIAFYITSDPGDTISKLKAKGVTHIGKRPVEEVIVTPQKAKELWKPDLGLEIFEEDVSIISLLPDLPVPEPEVPVVDEAAPVAEAVVV